MPTTREDLPLTTAHLAYLLDCCGDAFIVCDADESMVLVNQEVARIFGYAESDLLAASIRMLMPERYRARHAKGFAKRLEDPSHMPIRYVEVEGLHADGHEFPIEVRFTHTPLDGDVYFTASIRDVTAQVQARHEIERLNAALEQERDYLREEVRAAGHFGDIVGDSAALKMVLAQVEAVAKTNATVLVLGESGSGKELIARAIHEQSDRHDRALVKVNCASVPRELFESEFFGHKKGAFTGAVADRTGRFQLADGGTIFLDEVGEIPLEQQSKLLRVLQEQELERLGDERTQKVDVRVVAATNRDLREEVKAGRFREDLYYRLGVFPVVVPPLRERPEDVLPLATHFLERSSKNLKVPAPKLPRRVAERLQRYAWPGNIRELQNVMERAVILARGESISEGMLHLDDDAPAVAPRPKAAPAGSDAERIRAALAEHGGNVSKAASALGLSRQALYRRMDKFGIPRR